MRTRIEAFGACGLAEGSCFNELCYVMCRNRNANRAGDSGNNRNVGSNAATCARVASAFSAIVTKGGR